MMRFKQSENGLKINLLCVLQLRDHWRCPRKLEKVQRQSLWNGVHPCQLTRPAGVSSDHRLIQSVMRRILESPRQRQVPMTNQMSPRLQAALLHGNTMVWTTICVAQATTKRVLMTKALNSAVPRLTRKMWQCLKLRRKDVLAKAAYWNRTTLLRILTKMPKRPPWLGQNPSPFHAVRFVCAGIHPMKTCNLKVNPPVHPSNLLKIRAMPLWLLTTLRHQLLTEARSHAQAKIYQSIPMHPQLTDRVNRQDHCMYRRLLTAHRSSCRR